MSPGKNYGEIFSHESTLNLNPGDGLWGKCDNWRWQQGHVEVQEDAVQVFHILPISHHALLVGGQKKDHKRCTSTLLPPFFLFFYSFSLLSPHFSNSRNILDLIDWLVGVCLFPLLVLHHVSIVALISSHLKYFPFLVSVSGSPPFPRVMSSPLQNPSIISLSQLDEHLGVGRVCCGDGDCNRSVRGGRKTPSQVLWEHQHCYDEGDQDDLMMPLLIWLLRQG